MKKVVLSTIIWFISMILFAQNEPTKYLIKYLETNTAQPDYVVSFFSDTQFIFKSPNTDKINTNSSKQSESNLFIATFDDNGDITEKKEIQGMPTNKVTKTGATYSPNKKKVYFSAKKFRKKARRNDREQLFQADVDENGNWINIEKLPFSKESHSFGEPSLSSDGSELYFTSNMPGTLGGADIFKVEINSIGEFGQPINLGNTINTSGNEVTPYITKKKVLYFSSDNHIGGLGNLDVYSLDLNNQEAKPKHLDSPINSINDDFSFIMSPNENRGYFASNRLQGQNNHDIYSFLVEQEEKEGPCMQSIVGVVKDNETKEVIANALITLYDDTQNEINAIKTDNDGKYSLTLDCNQTYTIRAGGNIYHSEDHIVNTANYLEAPTLEANKFLSKKLIEEIETEDTRIVNDTQEENMVENAIADIKKDNQLNVESKDINDEKEDEKRVEAEAVDNSIIEDEATINPVYFGFDKAIISRKSAIELDKLGEILKNNKSIHIELSSYTDSRGSRAYNLKLSERRAKASADYLVAQGIDRSRIKAKGYGESKMVNKCIDGIECSEAAHEKNRRTEFAFINSHASINNFDNNTTSSINLAIDNKTEKTETIKEISKLNETENLTEIPVDNNEKYVIKEEAENLTEPIKSDIASKIEIPKSEVTDNRIDIKNDISNKSEVAKSDLYGANDTSNIKVEKISSDEAKWLNNEIEKSNQEENVIKEKTISDEKSAISRLEQQEINNDVIVVNSSKDKPKKPQLIEPIKDTSKDKENSISQGAMNEEANKAKFNFEQEVNKPTATDDLDPNQLLANLKAKAVTQKTKSANVAEVKAEHKPAKLTIDKSKILSTSQVNIAAMQSKRGKYIETDKSKKINALRITFRVQANNNAKKGYKDAYVVVKSPAGKIVNEKGVFELVDGKKQSYTDQTTLYYNKQSIKSVMFIDKIVHKFTEGVYTVNIYIDGVDIGENILTLS